jgi:hypothetical protein
MSRRTGRPLEPRAHPHGCAEGMPPRPFCRTILQMPASPPRPPSTLSALAAICMLLCAVILIGLALAGSLQQLRGTHAPVAIVAK